MSPSTIKTDIAIVGGGVAGLWLLSELRGAGYHAVLLEANALGHGQTIASQGMIHGGIKYALSGGLTQASEAIASMPARWREALAGLGHVDLSSTTVLSDHFYMWSPGDISSRLGTFVASRALRGRIDKIARSAYPPLFNTPEFRGQLLKLVDLVVDVPSLLRNLADNNRGHIFSATPEETRLTRGHDDKTNIVTAAGVIQAQRVILAAGLGNENLLSQLGSSQPETQRRPLHQVLLRHDAPHELYGHCMGRSASPRLTVSTHKAEDGSSIWYLGGDLATNHIDKEPAALIDIARRELAEIFPWLDFGHQQWATLRIDRAEPRQPRLLKPDRAFASLTDTAADVIACWPTKLALAPDLAKSVLALLSENGVQPRGGDDLSALSSLGTPAVAAPFWQGRF